MLLRGPHPALRDLVDGFWATNTYPARTARERVLPSGSVRVVIHLEAFPLELYHPEVSPEPLRFSGGALVGARTTPLVLETAALGGTVGVDFKPGAITHFQSHPAAAFADQVVVLDAVWGRPVSFLREQLLETKDQWAQIMLLERFLLQRACGQLQRRPSLRASLAAFEEYDLKSVADVTSRVGLSHKRLSALFRDEVGLGPKSFWRLRRFHSAVRKLGHGVRSGAALAAECGYFDQAHLIREFRAFAGSGLREYLANRVADSDHVSLPG
jgi:AraC-like DNA-binding protein